jgi:RNA polymerase II subunit A small phosphatase-like protein
MSVLGWDMKDTILIDNSPTSYMLQPECGLPILSWYDDKKDRVLMEYIPLLIELSKVHDVREVIPKFVKNHNFDMSYAMTICAHQIRR